jgi:integrase
MRITEFLQLKWKAVQPSLEKGEMPVKIMLRNDRGREYFTFLGNDGAAAIKLYLNYRKSLVRAGIKPDEYLFVNDVGCKSYRTDKPLLKDYVERQIVRAVTAKGLIERNGDRKWRSDFHPHALRHLFKTECAHAGTNPMISEFWMGHDKGVEYVYNHQHELHPEDFVEAYRKVEPYLSVSTPEDWADQKQKMGDLEQRIADLEKVYSEKLKIKES